MGMQTNLAGRLRNTHLPFASGLLPLFEAVVNSIHGIEEAEGDSIKGKVEVEIFRKLKQENFPTEEGKKKRGPDAQEDIVGFSVTDNGIGFTDANMVSFQTLDTDHKVAKGCRGVGRLLWLKAFKRVKVESVFLEKDEKFYRRIFEFNPAGVEKEKKTLLEGRHECKTVIQLDDFLPSFRGHTHKTLKAISEDILEHCLWYFVRVSGAPKITIWDSGESIPLDDLYDEQMCALATTEKLKIDEHNFELTHVKLRSNSLSNHAIAFCADNRLVSEEPISGKISGLHGRIDDADSSFIYMCYVSSKFLDDHARPERTGFEIPENIGELFSKTEMTFPRIREAVLERAAAHLKTYLEFNLTRARERVEKFVAQKAPRYRPILSRIPDFSVDPDINDKELDSALHKRLYEIEGELIKEGHELIATRPDTLAEDYQKRLEAYLSKAEDLKMSDLANYVSHRKVIIELLAKAITRDQKGKYTAEDVIHGLIMPMRKTSNEIMPDRSNLWLIDERLAFHDYMASDKTIVSMPITDATSTREPDVVSLRVFDNPILFSEATTFPLASIVVVEIKKPMRNDAAPGEYDDPVEQAVSYLNLIRQGKAKTAQGRPIPQSDDIPGFCYIVADITPTFRDRCLIHHDLKWKHDKMGFFGYKANCNAYIEVISFDGLVNAAKERNRAFFDKLGLPAD